MNGFAFSTVGEMGQVIGDVEGLVKTDGYFLTEGGLASKVDVGRVEDRTMGASSEGAVGLLELLKERLGW